MSTAPGVDSSAPGPKLPGINGYKVLEQIGRGGMGSVWAADQLGTRRKVAIKVLPPLASDRARARFEMEVNVASRLKHPYIVSIYDSGAYLGKYFYVMEYVEGVHLDEYVLKHELSDAEIVALMAKICRAVDHAHQHGVIHRDLKPSNILVTEDGQPHVLDFGLAKAARNDAGELHMTLSGEVAGTPAFMSPEQAAGRPDLVTTRSDVYSLGVILYLLLTGKFTHEVENPAGRQRATATQEVTPPRSARPDIPRRLENILLMALQLQPEKRYASAGEFARDLENYPRGVLIAQPETSYDILLKRMRQYYAPLGIGAALLAKVGLTTISRTVTGPHLNAYSLYDLVGFLLTFAVGIMFLASYCAMGRRATDLLFGTLMLIMSVASAMYFLMDNLVPDSAPAAAYAHQAPVGLALLRYTFLVGLLSLPVTVHFTLLYCGYGRWSGRRAIWIYLAYLMFLPLMASPQFLSARTEQAGDFASWTCMVPWNPVVGPLVAVYFGLWLGSHLLVQIILYNRKRRGGIVPQGPLSQINCIRLTFAVQALGVFGDIAMGCWGLMSFSPYVITAVLGGFIMSFALVRERMEPIPFAQGPTA